MRWLIPPLLIASLGGCAVYSVDPAEGAPALHPAPDDTVRLVKLNPYPEGFQCFEPYWYFITVGIVPTRCVDTYRVWLERPAGKDQSTYTVTAIAGWEALFLMPFSGWHAGNASVSESVIENLIRHPDH